MMFHLLNYQKKLEGREKKEKLIFKKIFFFSLSNLRILEVRENLLKILPESLVHLSKLESLDLGSNVLEQLPQNLGYLQSLNYG